MSYKILYAMENFASTLTVYTCNQTFVILMVFSLNGFTIVTPGRNPMEKYGFSIICFFCIKKFPKKSIHIKNWMIKINFPQYKPENAP